MESSKLEKAYVDPSKAGSLGGVKAFARANRISLKKAREVLTKVDTYNLHKPVRWRFKRARTVTKGIDDLWQADLAEMGHFARHKRVSSTF